MNEILECKNRKNIKKIVVIGHGNYDADNREVEIVYKGEECKRTATKLKAMTKQLKSILERFSKVTQVRFQICNFQRCKVKSETKKQSYLDALSFIEEQVNTNGRTIELSAPKYLSSIESKDGMFVATDLKENESFIKFKDSKQGRSR